jgi:hypothetical protein
MLAQSLDSLLRWEGTPFIIKSGKALDDHKSGTPLLLSSSSVLELLNLCLSQLLCAS